MDNNDEKNFLLNKILFFNFINKMDDDTFKKLSVLIKLIKKQYSNLTIAIKTPNLSSERWWGDYFFAVSLKKSLEKRGFQVFIHEREYWYKDDFDIAIVLRGLFDYSIKPGHINIMWNISHPNIIQSQEYEKYDVVFIASDSYSEVLNNKLNTLVRPLLQCTDSDKFKYQKNDEFIDDILFVGISRGNILRNIVRDILDTNHDFSVYGFGWEGLIDSKYIKGEFIDNNELNKAYSGCKILLNDHWDDMFQRDFVSNRIFDALACKTFVISDNVKSIRRLFAGNVVTYNNSQDLNVKLNYYLEHADERKLMANKGYQIVLKNHTFDNRVSEILYVLEKIFYYKFLNQFSVNANSQNFSNNVNQNMFVKLLNEFVNYNLDEIVQENKNLNLKVAKLHEKILFLENEKSFNRDSNSYVNKFLNFFKFF